MLKGLSGGLNSAGTLEKARALLAEGFTEASDSVSEIRHILVITYLLLCGEKKKFSIHSVQTEKVTRSTNVTSCRFYNLQLDRYAELEYLMSV